MALPVDRRRGGALLFPLLDEQAHRPLGNDVAEPPVAVRHERRRRLVDDVERRSGDDVPALDAVDVRGNLDDAVGVVPRKVRPDDVAGDDAGLLPARSGALEQAVGDVLQSVVENGWHGSSVGMGVRSGLYRQAAPPRHSRTGGNPGARQGTRARAAHAGWGMRDCHVERSAAQSKHLSGAWKGHDGAASEFGGMKKPRRLAGASR